MTNSYEPVSTYKGPVIIYGRGGGRRESIMQPEKSLPHLFLNKIFSYPTGGMLEKKFTPPKLILLQRQRSRNKICNET